MKSSAQRLKPKAQLSLSPKLSSRLSLKAQVRLSSVGHYHIPSQIYFGTCLMTFISFSSCESHSAVDKVTNAPA